MIMIKSSKQYLHLTVVRTTREAPYAHRAFYALSSVPKYMLQPVVVRLAEQELYTHAQDSKGEHGT